jgi:hypothetical protein
MIQVLVEDGWVNFGTMKSIRHLDVCAFRWLPPNNTFVPSFLRMHAGRVYMPWHPINGRMVAVMLEPAPQYETII